MLASGNTEVDAPLTSHYIDLDGDTLTRMKNFIGDVRVFRYCPSDTTVPDTPRTTRDSISLCRGDSATLFPPVGILYQW